MWLGELVFDPSGRRSMELLSKLVASSRRYKLMVGFICSLGLFCILLLIVTFGTQHRPTGLRDTLMHVLPVGLLIIVSGIILPICYLVSIRRIGQRLTQLSGEAKPIEVGTLTEMKTRPDGPVNSISSHSLFTNPISWAKRVARDKALFPVMLGASVVIHAFPLAVIWLIVKSCPWYQAEPLSAVIILPPCVLVAVLGALSTVAYLIALRQVLAGSQGGSRGLGRT